MTPKDDTSNPGARRARSGSDDDAETESAGGCLVRLAWIFLGPLLLLAYLAHLVRHQPAAFSLESLGFWGVLGAVILARYVDFKRFGGETAQGTVATSKDFSRYSVWLVVGGTIAWAGALFI